MKSGIFHQVGLLLLIVAPMAIGGCGSRGPERVVVSGEVTYRGTPVEAGRIRFFPQDGTVAPMSGAYITDGKYVADHQGGVPAGTFSVEIEAHRVDPNYAHLETSMPGDIEADLPRQQFLPDKYNKHTTLELAVPSGRATLERDFALEE